MFRKKLNYLSEWRTDIIEWLIPKEGHWCKYEFEIIGIGKQLSQNEFEGSQIFGYLRLAELVHSFFRKQNNQIRKKHQEYYDSIKDLVIAVQVNINTSEWFSGPEYSLKETSEGC